MIEKTQVYDADGKSTVTIERTVPWAEQWLRNRYRYWNAKQTPDVARDTGRLFFYIGEEELLSLDSRLHRFALEMPAVIAELARPDRELWERTGADDLLIVLRLMPSAPPEPPPAQEPAPEPVWRPRRHELWDVALDAPKLPPAPARAPVRLRMPPPRRETRELVVENPDLRKRDELERRKAWQLVKDTLPSNAKNRPTTIEARLNPHGFSRRARLRWADFLREVADHAAKDVEWWRRSGFEHLQLSTTTSTTTPRSPATVPGFLSGPPAPNGRPRPMAPIGFAR
jgi:hypothetical protein